jgi:cell shape-determining protein MreD
VTVDALKAALVLFAAVLVQVSVLSAYSPLGGLLIDTANLGTLGFTSLLLTLAGFWIGRYGETTARDRLHAPYLSVGVVTVLYAFGALALRFVLGEPAPAGAVLAGLPAAVLFNLLLTWPVYALVRRLFPPHAFSDRVHEVRLLG